MNIIRISDKFDQKSLTTIIHISILIFLFLCANTFVLYCLNIKKNLVLCPKNSCFLLVQGIFMATSTEHPLIKSSISDTVKPKLTTPRVLTVYRALVPTLYKPKYPQYI